MVRDLIVDELERSRRRSFDAIVARAWDEATPVRSGSLDLDSLERFTIAARLNETFELYTSGVEDNLLRAQTIGDTLDVVMAGLPATSKVCFYSGGTTGAPTLHHHSVAALSEEAHELARICAPAGRVIVTVPVHHIYGFLFGALMPQYAECEAVDARWSLLQGSAAPRAGDVVVGVPFFWERIASRTSSWPAGVTVTSSTAPLAPATRAELVASGVRVVEVYGSSETSGIGWRESGGGSEAAGGLETDTARESPGPQWYTLFPWWQRHGTALTHRDRDTVAVEPPDHLEWSGDRLLRPRGRRDTVVQVGGVNVDTERVRTEILRVAPEAEACAVRLGSNGRLSAFLVHPDPDWKPDLSALSDRLPAAAIPRSVTVGRTLPRTAMGKIADWQEDSEA